MDERERDEYENDALEFGIPVMLDRMGLDGIGNDVIALYKRIIKLEAELAVLKAQRCEECTWDGICSIQKAWRAWSPDEPFACNHWVVQVVESDD